MLISATVYGGFTANTDAGYLYGPAGTALPTGSLLLLIAAGGDQTFSNALLPGQFVSGNDFILGAVAINGIGGTSPTGGVDSQNAFNVTLSPAVGDYLALRWFSNITLAQYNSGSTPVAGNTFGTYSAGNTRPDGGSNWTAPSSGSSIILAFYTLANAGTQLDSSGFASSIVAVPEPSSLVFLSLGAIAGLGTLYRSSRRR